MSINGALVDGAPRRRGRPVGGGNNPEQARRALVKAAEECFTERGLGVTMADVAGRAGVTRAVLYRHFAGREDLIVAVATQAMDGYVAQLTADLMPTTDAARLITETLVFMTTVAVRDPLLTLLSSDKEYGVASLLAKSPILGNKVSELYEGLFVMLRDCLRPGLEPGDVGRYVLSVALTLLMSVVPGSDSPDTVRRYVQTFILPAIITDPPAATVVF